MQLAGNASVPAGCGGVLTFVGDPGHTETFEYQAGDFCTTEWTETDPDTIISTYDSTEVKNGTYALSIATDGVNREDNYVQANTGGADGDFSISFWYYAYDVADYNDHVIMASTESATIAEGSGFDIRHIHYDTGNAQFKVSAGASNDTSSSISTNAWYRIEIDFNQNASSTVEIYNTAEALQDTLTFTAQNKALQYHTFGCIFSDASAASTQYYDDIKYKSGGGGF